jgi:hypothetical protein
VSTIAERVAAGAAWLDEHEPGWVDRIDTDRLDLSSRCRCVLGQLEMPLLAAADADDAFEIGVERRQLSIYTTSLLGFDRCPWGLPIQTYAETEAEYDQLTAAWRELIATRRATPAGGP